MKVVSYILRGGYYPVLDPHQIDRSGMTTLFDTQVSFLVDPITIKNITLRGSHPYRLFPIQPYEFPG